MYSSGFLPSKLTSRTAAQFCSSGTSRTCPTGLQGNSSVQPLNHKASRGLPKGIKPIFPPIFCQHMHVSAAHRMPFTQPSSRGQPRFPFPFLPVSCPAPASLGPRRTKMICSHKQFASDLSELFQGNLQYMATMSEDNPGLLATLAIEGQKPPFMLVDCSDSSW
ncbi:hypothetical protein GALMADRAFT_1131106 [Galerina marginata CBS 339.88]|uniref:Uncharacterized protein n=1 Tax=Galerina marginata (strain CBS 339.88) TaxID=685588 RepID=A0A067SKA2_GALM3|nr:hypothetical protein GALMADRAFT_1131106 [Galerina marginata CBS 339.88]